jgi:hypothetical protein
LAALDWKRRQVLRTSEAVSYVRDLNGSIRFDYQVDNPWQEAPGPEWMRRSLGNDMLAEVVVVCFNYPSTATDNDLKVLRNFPKLKQLHLGAPRVTDRGLIELQSCPYLDVLTLGGTVLTDRSVEYLGKCRKLKWLRLNRSTSADLKAKLKRLLPADCTIDYDG